MSDRFEIVDSKLMPGMSKAWNVWTVLDRGSPIAVTLTREEAEQRLNEYKVVIANQCDHPTFTAEADGVQSILIECTECGLVGEMPFSMDDITWIGQQ